jgi:hypothetical protein
MSIEIEFYLFGLLTGFAIAMGVMWIWEQVKMIRATNDK